MRRVVVGNLAHVVVANRHQNFEHELHARPAKQGDNTEPPESTVIPEYKTHPNTKQNKTALEYTAGVISGVGVLCSGSVHTNAEADLISFRERERDIEEREREREIQEREREREEEERGDRGRERGEREIEI